MGISIAYLTSQYARAGDTFIRREVEELRGRGFVVHTFSIQHPGEREAVSEEIRREQRSTDYILRHGPLALLLALVRTALRSPRRLLRAALQARALRWPGLRSALWHVFYLLEACYLAEQLRARKVELLHDHISMNSATVALLASTLAGVPFSMSVHGPHDFLEAERWALGRKVAASALTLCISDFGRSQCMLFSAPRDWPRIEVQRCGVDASFLEGSTAPAGDSRTLVCVGRLSPEKGQVLLVDAAARLRDQGVDVDVALIGDGPARADLEERIRVLGVAGRVRLLGWKGSAEVRGVLAASRALVLPSFAEGIPVVLMEAMAQRRPVIATYVAGIPELVRDGESGWLVPAGSIGELARAMREVVEAPAARLAEMGERGRQAVLERHHPSEQGERLAELLTRAAKGSRSGAG